MRCHKLGLRTTASVAALMTLFSSLTSCVSDNSPRPATSPSNQSADSACDRQNEAAMATVFAAAAGIAGYFIGGKKAGGAIAGVLVGGLIGDLIGRDMDARSCAMKKIAQQAGTTVRQDDIIWHQPATSTGAAATKEEQVRVGHVDRWEDSAFPSGSAELTPAAKAYFTSAAKLYLPVAPDQQKLRELQGSEREQYLASVKARNEVPLLMVGNTDDVGDSRSNQKLSEDRAHTVGALFASVGVDASRIFYWGAGETRPVADNRTEEGRSQNRRVDIIQFQNQKVLQAYIQEDRPNTQFYRPPVTTTVAPKPTQAAHASEKSSPPPAPPTPVASTATATTSPPPPEPTPTAPQPSPSVKKALVDFGGQPVSGSLPSLIDEAGGTKAPAISFGFISQAFAASPPTSSCTEDRARQGGTVKSLATGKPIEEYSTAEFVPGMNGVPWVYSVNDNLVALSGVGVLRSGARPISDPTVKVFPNWSKVKNQSAAKPAYSLNAVANTYEANNGFLYRIFVEDKQQVISCADILIPNSGVGAQNGRLHYYANSQEFAALYKPAAVR
jgi:outer membrane protein OmpA-like peptidoglycan-associated protein